MRTNASVKNSIFITIMIVLKILISFVAQKIFVNILNIEFLGVNGLFTNIITILSLAELGIGEAIIFNLYKPIAHNDKEMIKSLLKLYEKAYNAIAIVVLGIGISLIPFLKYFIGETTLDLNFNLVYILFLLQCVASYVLTYKRSILYAYQQNYIISIIDIIYLFVLNIVQLLVLYWTKNYYLYLGIKILCVLAENIVITFISNKKYKFIKEKDVKKLDEKIEKDISNRIKAQLFHKIGGIVVSGTDNIIISNFFGLIVVGLYSNYLMVISAVTSIICQLIGVLIPSIGNLLIENNKQKSFEVYKKIRFFNFWITTFSGVAILVVIQSFIRLWMGNDYLLSFGVVCVLVLNYYLRTMRSSNDVFLGGAGICIETKFVPLVEATLNIAFSIICLKIWGLAGVFIGTIISSLALWCYSYPKFVYKNLLDGKYSNYIKENLIYLLIFIAIASVTYLISMIFTINNLWIDIIVRVLLCVIIPNLILLCIYGRTVEFKYFKDLIMNILKRKLR